MHGHLVGDNALIYALSIDCPCGGRDRVRVVEQMLSISLLFAFYSIASKKENMIQTCIWINTLNPPSMYCIRKSLIGNAICRVLGSAAAHTQTQTHVHACMYTHTHMHTHTHTHTLCTYVYKTLSCTLLF